LQQRRRMFPGTRGNSGSTRVLILKGGNPLEHQEAFNRAGLATRSASHLLFPTPVPLRRPLPRDAPRSPLRPVDRTVRDHGTHTSAANSFATSARRERFQTAPGARSFGVGRYTWPDFSIPEPVSHAQSGGFDQLQLAPAHHSGTPYDLRSLFLDLVPGLRRLGLRVAAVLRKLR
jgi:hypothetical protein